MRESDCFLYQLFHWNNDTHTSITSWGEFAHTLEDIFTILGLPITRIINIIHLGLSSKEEKDKKLAFITAYKSCIKASVGTCYTFSSWLSHCRDFFAKSRLNEDKLDLSACLAALVLFWLSRFIFYVLLTIKLSYNFISMW